MSRLRVGMDKHKDPDVAGCLEFDYEELKSATHNFDQRPASQGGCKLGEGGFGPVFKGKLKFTEVAIKILRNTPKGDAGAATLANEQFISEVIFLTRFRHPNLVTLIGFTNKPNWKSLIYEFLPNGTLEDALEIGYETWSSNGPNKKNQGGGGIHIPWMCRMSIATDTARGLAYLHTADKRKPLVHRDVKSANVLLDLSFRAKVGDFGLALPLQEDKKEARTARVVGTSGYIPPEYYRGVITTKMDTFGYGVSYSRKMQAKSVWTDFTGILLEMISGMPSYDPRRTPKDLISFMEADMEEDRPNILCTKVDEHAGNWPSSAFLELFRVAKKCVEPKLNHRPEIAEVYPKLEELVTDSAIKYAEQAIYNKQKQKI